MATDQQRERDAPWVMRTYSGHSTARASNELYRTNLAKGQTGLSIAFDLPTQTGYDPDAPEAAGEVGKVGVPVAHLGHMEELLDRHPRRDHEHLHDDQRHGGVAARALRRPRAGQGCRPGAAGGHDAERHRQGVSQPGDLHLPAGTEPPAHRRHHRLHGAAHAQSGTRSTCAATTCRRRGRRRCRRSPTRWPPPSACSTACGPRARSTESELPAVVGRISFFVNSSVRFVEETCKMRAFTEMWDRICRERYGVEDPKLRRFRYGVQVNSLGLTEQQPENNVQRIVLESLGVTLVQERPGPGHAAAGMERGARAAPALGPAVVPAHAAGAGLRVRPARVRRHLRGLESHRGQDGRAGRGGLGRARRRAGAGRCLRGDRRAQAAARAQPGRAGPAHRVGRAEGRRRQLLHRDRAVAAGGRRGDSRTS